jgi:hypothetical protein
MVISVDEHARGRISADIDDQVLSCTCYALDSYPFARAIPAYTENVQLYIAGTQHCCKVRTCPAN